MSEKEKKDIAEMVKTAKYLAKKRSAGLHVGEKHS